MIKYCPQCRGEYEQWVEKCADCDDVRLVNDLPAQSENASPKDDLESRIQSAAGLHKDLVPVYESTDSEDIKVVLEELQAEGIDGRVISSSKGGRFRFGAAKISPQVVVVKQADAIKAHKIVDSLLA